MARQARSLSHVSIGAVAIGMTEYSLRSFEAVRRTGDGNPLELAGFRLPWPRRQMPGIEPYEIRHVKVQAAIIVVIPKRGTHAPFGKSPMGISYTRSCRHVREGSIAVIPL